MFSMHDHVQTKSWNEETRDVIIACAWVAAVGFGMVLAVVLAAAA